MDHVINPFLHPGGQPSGGGNVRLVVVLVVSGKGGPGVQGGNGGNLQIPGTIGHTLTNNMLWWWKWWNWWMVCGGGAIPMDQLVAGNFNNGFAGHLATVLAGGNPVMELTHPLLGR